jgi:hypothetical protein
MSTMMARFLALVMVAVVAVVAAATPAAASSPGDPIQGNGFTHGGIYVDPFDEFLGIAASTPVTFGGTFHDVSEESLPAFPTDTTYNKLGRVWKGNATPFANYFNFERAATMRNPAELDLWEQRIREWMQVVKRFTDGDEVPVFDLPVEPAGRSLIIAPFQEMNGVWTPYGCYQDPTTGATLSEKATYKELFRRVVQIGREEGLDETRVRWAFAPNGGSSAFCGPAADYYPGDDWVDVIAVSSYNFGALDPFFGWQSPKQILKPFDGIRKTISPNRPYLLAQTATVGSASGSVNNKDAWIGGLFDEAAADPNVVGIIYFNESKFEGQQIQFFDYSCCPAPQQGWTGWVAGMSKPTTLYDWPLTNWFQSGPLPFNQTPPIAKPDAAFVNPDGSILVDVSKNDSDPDGIPTTAVLTVPAGIPPNGPANIAPAHGSVTVRSDGKLVYQHDGGASASDIFTYQAFDGNKVSPPATVTIGITPIAITLGLVDPGSGQWHLRRPDGGVNTFFYGNAGDAPFLGDWDCDGIDTPGLYRSDGFVYLRNSNTTGNADWRFFFGNPGDLPIIGDFDGDGCDTVSVYRPGEGRVFLINSLGANGGSLGPAERSYSFGNPGDTPFAGDFNGNGVDTVGLYRESTGLVYMRQTHTTGNANLSFFFGNPGDRFVTGSWVGNPEDSPAVFRPADAAFYLRYTNTQGFAGSVIPFGEGDWLPIAGVTSAVS